MHLFYAPQLDSDAAIYSFDEEESKHCIRVLRLQTGDAVHLTDGRGTLCEAVIEQVSSKRCSVRIVTRTACFEKRDYTIQMAVAPTKNIERFEWFTEKATEIGVDRITPLLTAHCERRIVKQERLEKVATSAVKQSLKAYHPVVNSLTPFAEVVCEAFDGVKLIAHCDPDQDKRFVKDCVGKGQHVKILIGPEGDFSPEEIALAREHGFTPISLGRSRLRTETAALYCVAIVALINE